MKCSQHPSHSAFACTPCLAEEGTRIITRCHKVLDFAGIEGDGQEPRRGLLEARIGILVVERDRLQREVLALATVLENIAAIANEQAEHEHALDGPLTDWERVRMLVAHAEEVGL